MNDQIHPETTAPADADARASARSCIATCRFLRGEATIYDVIAAVSGGPAATDAVHARIQRLMSRDQVAWGRLLDEAALVPHEAGGSYADYIQPLSPFAGSVLVRFAPGATDETGYAAVGRAILAALDIPAQAAKGPLPAIPGGACLLALPRAALDAMQAAALVSLATDQRSPSQVIEDLSAVAARRTRPAGAPATESKTA